MLGFAPVLVRCLAPFITEMTDPGETENGETLEMRESSVSEPVRVLFLCTHNSARSQIAEALLDRKGRGRFYVASAGTEPVSAAHPLALAALRRAGIEWDDHRPKGLEEVMRGRPWDLVITLCDKAHETCPSLSGRPVAAHWGVPDPAAVGGDEKNRAAAFWETLTLLGRRIDLLCALPEEKLRELGLEVALRELGVFGATTRRSTPR